MNPKTRHTIRCPLCGAQTEVRETRTSQEDRLVIRRRRCTEGHTFVTEESVLYLISQATPTNIVKRAPRKPIPSAELRELEAIRKLAEEDSRKNGRLVEDILAEWDREAVD